jgi:ABC-2 type transport system ATP-binding protein
MIETINLTKYFGKKTAVRDLNLKIPAGELFALIGPNGAGKSTTIKILVGLLRPSRGEALIAGHDIQKHPVEAKREIGYIPDFPFLYEKLTGEEFIRFVGRLYRVEESELRRRARRYLELFGLEELRGELIENYSHGYRQRLVFAAAFLHEPRILIIDEPMVGLDPRTARLIKDLLRERCRRGTAVLMSTHTLSVAEEIAHRVGIIHRGKLIAAGSLEELRRQSGISGRLEEVFLKISSEKELRTPDDQTRKD